jgi:hypothetical protein
MKRYTLMLSVMVLGALAFAATAGATASVPDLEPAVAAYGDTILDNLVDALSAVLPYAAVFTVVGIGVTVLKRWIGRRSAVGAVK